MKISANNCVWYGWSTTIKTWLEMGVELCNVVFGQLTLFHVMLLVINYTQFSIVMMILLVFLLYLLWCVEEQFFFVFVGGQNTQRSLTRGERTNTF